MNFEKLQTLLNAAPVGFLPPTAELFKRTNAALFTKHKKLGVIVDDYEEHETDSLSPVKQHSKNDQIYCNEIGCNAVFTSSSEFQSHFNSCHRFICAECKRALPTAHLLDLHIEEQHDSYFAARLARGNEPMYACYLEACTERMTTPEQRKEHCIKAHKFPANYRFDQIKQKTQNKHKPKDKLNAMDVDTNELSEPYKGIPYIKAFSFGHHREKAFSTTRGTSKSNAEAGKTLENVQDLKAALNDIE